MGLNVNGQNFRVMTTNEPIGGENGKRFFIGQSDETKNIIVIDGTLPSTRQDEVLLHEMIHLLDSSLPEFLVSNLSKGLYGILKENRMISSTFLSRISDGNLSRDDMARINEQSNELAEQSENTAQVMDVTSTILPDPKVVESYMRVSEKPFYLDPINADGELNVRDQDGKVNRNAVYMAASQVAGARGGIKLESSKRHYVRNELLTLYKYVLKETPPKTLTR